jgi:hypothetical protein
LDPNITGIRGDFNPMLRYLVISDSFYDYLTHMIEYIYGLGIDDLQKEVFLAEGLAHMAGLAQTQIFDTPFNAEIFSGLILEQQTRMPQSTPAMISLSTGGEDIVLEAGSSAAVFGRADQFNDVRLFNVSENNIIVFNDIEIDPQSISTRFSSLVVDMDFDLDGEIDTSFTLEGRFGGTELIIEFVNGSTQLSIDFPGLSKEEAQTVALLYEAGLDRDGEIDLPGLNFWIDGREAGLSERDLSWAFLSSSEFQETFGDATDADNADYLDDQALVEQLYLNVLNRPGEALGVEFWTNVLGGPGFDRADVLLAFAVSPENVQNFEEIDTLTQIRLGEWDFA